MLGGGGGRGYDGGMATLAAPDFDLALTLRSGQFFRYRPVAGGGFEICTQGRVLRVRQAGPRVVFYGSEAPFVKRFLGLEDDGAAVRDRLRGDLVLLTALARLSGLRILRQDPWECTLAFICSACSNIPRISRNVEDLARRFGRPLGGGGWHALPRPGGIPSLRSLRPVRLGWRARYIHAASRSVSADWLESLGRRPLEEARAALRTIPGVGEKVAECILLFGLGFGGAFPVDVWVRRAVAWAYGRRRGSDRAIRAWAADRFGDCAGYAQQLLYVLAREEGNALQSLRNTQ